MGHPGPLKPRRILEECILLEAQQLCLIAVSLSTPDIPPAMSFSKAVAFSSGVRTKGALYLLSLHQASELEVA